jgi:hypothetical protein
MKKESFEEFSKSEIQRDKEWVEYVNWFRKQIKIDK